MNDDDDDLIELCDAPASCIRSADWPVQERIRCLERRVKELEDEVELKQAAMDALGRMVCELQGRPVKGSPKLQIREVKP